MMAIFKCFLDSLRPLIKTLSELDPLWQNFLDPRMLCFLPLTTALVLAGQMEFFRSQGGPLLMFCGHWLYFGFSRFKPDLRL